MFLYQSKNNQFLLHLLVTSDNARFLMGSMVWLSVLAIFAFIFKAKSGFQSLLLYTFVLVAASPAIANQYLAIIMPFIVGNLNLFFVLYIVVGTWYLLIDTSALNLTLLPAMIKVDRGVYYGILVSLLWFGFIEMIRPQGALTLMKKIFIQTPLRLVAKNGLRTR